MEVARLSALRTGRIYPPGDIPGSHFCYWLSRPQGHSAVGRVKEMKGIMRLTLDFWKMLCIPTLNIASNKGHASELF